jgi:hypothetical protein
LLFQGIKLIIKQVRANQILFHRQLNISGCTLKNTMRKTINNCTFVKKVESIFYANIQEQLMQIRTQNDFIAIGIWNDEEIEIKNISENRGTIMGGTSQIVKK